jgi:hypothetical protein
MQTELMAKASHDALVDAEPEIRPFVLTRSATAGTMRYAASSWSGDNVTSWDSMKGANALALNAGMSLLQVHDASISIIFPQVLNLASRTVTILADSKALNPHPSSSCDGFSWASTHLALP